MPVDAGIIGQGLDFAANREVDSPRSDDLLDTAESLGAALRMRREARGMTLEQLSIATRIRPQYLAALEAMRMAELPSRAFVVGYVRASAGVLGLDPDQAVARLKQDAPDGEPRLAAPLGVDRKSDPRLRMFVTLGVVVVLAIVAWNVAQRVMTKTANHHGGTAREAAMRAPPSSKTPLGPLALGAAQPPPAEATTPEPYITPGLDTVSGAPPAQQPQVLPALPVGAPFVAKGRVYGQSPAAAHIILQAAKPVTLVIHGADGSVYFARQLGAGESYAAPDVAGLSVDVSNPAVVSVFIDRAFKGPLPAPTAPISSLAGAPVHP